MTLSILIPEEVSKKVIRRLRRLAAKADVEITEVQGTTYVPRISKVAVRVTTAVAAAKYGRELGEIIGYQLKVNPAIQIPCARVTVGELPRDNGFKFVARIEHTEAGNIISCAPDEQCPPEYREAKCVCEHCGTMRPRKDTFIVRRPDGGLVQVGRNCLADFMLTDPKRMIAGWAFSDALTGLLEIGEDSEPGGGGWGGGDTGVQHFIACAVREIARHGYTPTSAADPEAGKVSTRARVAFAAYPCSSRDADVEAAWRDAQPTAEDHDKAREILAWAQALTDSGDYLYNVRIACSLPVVGRHGGLLASVPQAYEKAMGRERARREPKPPSEHVGTVGERREFTLTIAKQIEITNDWGYKTIYSMRDAAGNVVMWFKSGTALRDQDDRETEPGDTITIKATIKDHDEYKGTKQTVVARAKLISRTPAPADDADQCAA